MPRRRAWNGKPPRSPEDARRRLLEVARDCIERHGLAKAGLSDVAEAAGVTRQTVYRYFEDADDLFHSAAALASGGFHERIRRRALRRATLAERIVETIALCIHEIPDDPHLSALTQTGRHFTVAAALRLSFVQEELTALADGHPPLPRKAADELAELLLRLLHSFLFDPGEPRSLAELRSLMGRWLTPIVEAELAAHRGKKPARSRARAR